MANHFRSLNLAEILEEIQANESAELKVRDIFIEPPDPNALSDEDSANEDDGGMIDNLSSRQLAANAEVIFINDDRIGFDMDMALTFDVLPDEMLPSTSIEEQNNTTMDDNAMLVSDNTSDNQPTPDLLSDTLPGETLPSTTSGPLGP